MQNKIEPIGQKVVHLEPDSERVNRARLAGLPQVVQGVHQSSLTAFLGRLKIYFERADDALFDLADKAASNDEQNLFFDSMREVRVRRQSIEANFTRALDEAFAALVDNTPNPTPEDSYDTLKADALSLVHDDDLEALVAVDSSVARANSEFGEAIQYISLRIDSLVPVKVYQKNNPVGPDVICAAFMGEIKRLDVTIKSKLVLFRLFDKVVISGLGEIYGHINDVLIQHNIMPSLPSRGRRAQQTARPHGRRSTDEGVASSAPISQEGVVPQAPLAPETILELQQIFGEGDFSADMVHSTPQQLAASQLVQILNTAQRMPHPVDVMDDADTVRSIVAKIRARKTGAEFGRVEDQVMNLVNMLFDFILDDKHLAPAMKMLISRMQIPIIKVALADKTFFTQNGHVARKLLNEISTAAIGWQGDIQSGESDPLYKKIAQVIRTLLNDFDTDISIFSDLLAEFTAFLEKERKRANVLEKRMVDAADGKAKAEVARTTVALELEVRTAELVLPDELSKLIHDAWSNVLFVIALKHGFESKEWRDGLVTLGNLIWSVQQPTSPEHRQRLIKAVPDLIKTLRAGLDTISYNPFEMSSLFKALEELHLGCIRGKAVVVRKDSNQAPEEDVVLLDEASLPIPVAPVPPVEHTPKVKPIPAVAPSNPIEEIALSGLDPFSSAAVTNASISVREQQQTEPDPHHFDQVKNFVQGAWFDIAFEGESLMRCRLAAFIKPTGKYIFVNRNGMKVAEKTADELAMLLKKQRLKPLDNSMLFDRALETIVSDIRKTRPR